MDNKASLTRRIYDYFINRWYFTSLIFFVPLVWFFFSAYYISDYKNSGYFIFNIFLLLLTFIFVLFKAIADQKNEIGKKVGQIILNELIEEINLTKIEKFDRYVKYASTNMQEENFLEIINPELQINTLLKSIRNTFSFLCGIDQSNIGLSVMCNLDGKWTFLSCLNIEGDITDINKIINNNKTAAFQIINGKTNLVFWPDKRIGIENNQFIPSETDIRNHNIGSIYSRNIGIKYNDSYILQAILNLTTYSQQVCSAKDEVTKQRIEAKIMPSFELRLKVELCMLYIKNKCKQKNCI